MYRRTARGRVLLLVLLALAILLITLDFRSNGGGPLNEAKAISSTIIAPIQRGVTAVTRPIGNFFSSIGDLANLRSENQRLKGELEQSRSAAGEAQSLASDNNRMKAV